MLLMPVFDQTRKTPQYVQLYHYLKGEIAAGRLAEQTKLPSVRRLADLLAISTTPVELAYQQLMAEGFITSKPKSGYYVQKMPEPYQNLEQRSVEADEGVPLRDVRTYEYDFHLSKNDFSAFPFRIWRRLANQALRIEEKDLLFYGDPQGERGLRRELSAYLRQFRGLDCTPEQIVIAADQYLLLSFLCMMIKTEYAEAGIGLENPGYPLFRSTFMQHGFRVQPISLEEDGISVAELYDSQVRAAYVSPSHQYPKGMLMPISKRLELLEWAKRVDGIVIEDDYDGEFRYHGKPVPSLQGLIPDAPVVYMGGFSQMVAPALCITYMVLPRRLLAPFRRLQDLLLFEQSSSPLHQRTMQLFMETGFFEKHVRKMRNLYRKKHDAVIAAIGKHFGDKVIISGKDAGLHLFVKINSTKSEQELRQRAKEAGINIASAAYTWFEPWPPERKEFLIGFGGIELEKIEPGIKRLKEIWFD
ncbi:MAG: PLP-dependent aminotransferase family protein [Clostridia bacterium]